MQGAAVRFLHILVRQYHHRSVCYKIDLRDRLELGVDEQKILREI